MSAPQRPAAGPDRLEGGALWEVLAHLKHTPDHRAALPLERERMGRLTGRNGVLSTWLLRYICGLEKGAKSM